MILTLNVAVLLAVIIYFRIRRRRRGSGATLPAGTAYVEARVQRLTCTVARASKCPVSDKCGQGESLTCSAQISRSSGATRFLRRLRAPQPASLPITTRTRWRQCAKGRGRSG